MTSLLSSQKRKATLVTGPGVIPCASPKQAGKDLRLPGRDRQGPIRASEDLLGAEKVKPEPRHTCLHVFGSTASNSAAVSSGKSFEF
jgi:hypothetical protein